MSLQALDAIRIVLFYPFFLGRVWGADTLFLVALEVRGPGVHSGSDQIGLVPALFCRIFDVIRILHGDPDPGSLP